MYLSVSEIVLLHVYWNYANVISIERQCDFSEVNVLGIVCVVVTINFSWLVNVKLVTLS